MDLLKDNIKKLYLRFLIPSLGSAMVMSIYTMTDAIVIGKGIGPDALAALSITTPLMCILISFGILLGVGGSVQMSVCRGSGDYEKGNSFFSSSFLILAAVTLFFWVGYRFGMPQLLRIMGATDTLYPYSFDYMSVMNYFIPAVVISYWLAIFVRADEDPNRAMAGVLTGGVINIILDIVFVFPLKMGMSGAALASAIGMTVQVIVAATHFLSGSNELKFIRPHNIIRESRMIFGSGIPSFFNEFANGFIVLLFNIQILKYCGETALAVYSAISYCVILFNSLYTGVGQSVQPAIATNYGAEKWDRIAGFKRMSYITIFFMGAVFSLSGILFPETLCSVFMNMNEEIAEVARTGIRIYFIAFLPMGLSLLTSYYLQSVLRVRESLVISVLRNILISSAGIITFPLLFGGDSLWMVMPVTESVVLAISLYFLKKEGVKPVLQHHAK